MNAEVLIKKSGWKTTIVFILAFWFSCSVLIDFVMMPVLYTSGMMSEPGFIPASYSMFWVFNRIEMLCAAGVLTGALVLRQVQPFNPKLLLGLASALFSIALIYTYGLAPQMSALGVHLSWLNPSELTPAGMDSLHIRYWLLEVVKLTTIGLLLKRVYSAF